MPKITFFLRSNHDSANTHVIYCRVSYNGTKTEFSTKEKLLPCEWNQQFQRYVGKSKTRSKFLETYFEITASEIKLKALQGNCTTAKDLIMEKLPVHTDKKSLVAIIEEYIEQERNKRTPGTIRNHFVKLDNLKAFQNWTKIVYTSDNYTISEAQRFKDWFMHRAGTTNVDTANRNVLFYKSAMMDLVQKGKLANFSLILFNGEKDKPKPTVFLSRCELEALEKMQFKNKMLIQVKDLFLFQCYTGLSYADIWSDWQLIEENGSWILTGERAKNNQPFFVPVGSEIVRLMEKYNYQLPKYHNAVYNRILKELAMLANIEKTITTHTARKTFATLRDADGWTREAVAAMLGHRSTKTTERYYIGESFARIIEEMKKRNA